MPALVVEYDAWPKPRASRQPKPCSRCAPPAFLHVRPHRLPTVERRRERFTRRSRSQRSGFCRGTGRRGRACRRFLIRCRPTRALQPSLRPPPQPGPRSVTSQRTANERRPHRADLLRADSCRRTLRAGNRRERSVRVRLSGQLRLDEQVGAHDVGARARESTASAPTEAREPPVTNRHRPERSISIDTGIYSPSSYGI